MNARAVRLKKEARALFWPWCAVMIAGALPLVPHGSDFLRGIPDWIGVMINPGGFFFGIPLLAALAFGNEFQHRTLSLLLSQPAGRMEIWREKLMVATAAVASATLVFWYSWRSAHLRGPELWLAGICVMAATASMPFFSLLARSAVGGLALFSVPFGLVELIWIAFYEDNPPRAETMPALFMAALGYAVLMLWLGARKLARFQVTGGMAGDDLVMSGPNVIPQALAGWFRYRPTEPFFNLIRKELRLLRPVWLLGLLFAAYLIGLAVFRLLPDAARRLEGREMAFTLIPFVSLPLLLAILAGCLSLGEERTSGTHSWHLTLPVSARRQWLIKLLVSVCTGFVCAVLLPVLVLLAGWIHLRIAVPNLMIAVFLVSVASFWCACAVSGTARAAIWLFPVTIVINLAARCGDLLGQELAQITGTLRDFVVSWFQLSPLAFGDIQFIGPTLLDPLLDPRLFVPVLLLAVIQSYRLFRTQPEDSTLWMMRCLLPLAILAFLCGFSVSAGWVARWQAFPETQEAIEKLHAGGRAAQLTVEDLAKVSALSPPTRRWLRDSTISIAPDQAHSGYLATIHLVSGLDCRLAVAHYGGRPFNPEQPSCAQKRP